MAMQSLQSSLTEEKKRAKAAEDELKIVQRQMERMREMLSPGAGANNLGAILEENHELKSSYAELQRNVRFSSASAQMHVHHAAVLPDL